MSEHKPYDSFAKLVVGVLAAHREVIPEAELRVPSYGDILLRPGPRLEPNTGLLGTLVEDRLMLLEYFSERPSVSALLRIRAKGYLGVVLELQRKTDFAALRKTRIMIIGNGHSRRPLEAVWPGREWVAFGPGLWRAGSWPEIYYIDLLRLPVTLETAWLHVSGRSLWTAQALGLLVTSPDGTIQGYLSRLNEEAPQMLATVDKGEERATRHFLAAWEEAAALRQGRKEGLAVGHRSYQRLLCLLLSQRFGDASLPLLQRVEASTQLSWLEALGVLLAQGAELSTLEALPSEAPVASS